MKYYSIYELKKVYNRINNKYDYKKFKYDLEFIQEFNNIEDIQKEYKLKNKKSVYNYIIKDIDNQENYKNLLHNKYIIIKE